MIVFSNPGLMDLHAVTTFGASVKETKNPIGQFGTGLKYAIAVLLRHGCGIRIIIDGTVYAFGTKVQAIRGQDFGLVCMYNLDSAPTTTIHDSAVMAGTPCGFTTELGKHWELWMAYRELACNCMDEHGVITKEDYAVDGVEGRTIVCVSGVKFEEVWQNRQKYINEAKPHLVCGDILDVRFASTKDVYYRNVLVSTADQTMVNTYNFLRSMDLTEDRTLKHSFMVQHYVERAIMQSDNKEFIRRCILAPSQATLEGNFQYNCGVQLSQEFQDVTLEEYTKDKVKPNVGAVMAVRALQKGAFRPVIKQLSTVQQKSMAKAVAFCEQLGFDVSKYAIHVVEHLGVHTLALAMDNEIWISDRVFELGGTKMLASTLIEEFLHLDRGLKDESREMQQFLFDKIVTMGEEQLGEPL